MGAELAQRAQRVQLAQAVQPVAGSRPRGDDEPRALQVTKHARRPASACSRLAYREPVHGGDLSTAVSSLRGRLVAGQAVVGNRLPRGGGPHEAVLVRPEVAGIVEGAQPDARPLGLRPAGTEEIRAARGAERLRAALVWLVGAEVLLPGHDPDRRRARAAVGGARAARELLAARAVAERAGLERLRHLEDDAAAQAAAGHGSDVPSRP